MASVLQLWTYIHLGSGLRIAALAAFGQIMQLGRHAARFVDGGARSGLLRWDAATRFDADARAGTRHLRGIVARTAAAAAAAASDIARAASATSSAAAAACTLTRLGSCRFVATGIARRAGHGCIRVHVAAVAVRRG